MDCDKCPAKKECGNANKNLGYAERGLTYCPMAFLFDWAWRVKKVVDDERRKSS